MADQRKRPATLFVPGATPEQAIEIERNALLPVGTLMFGIDGDALYEQNGPISILQVPTGAVLFQVTRDAHANLHFLHASPATGTRMASVALPEREPGGQFRISRTWDASETALYAGFVGTAPVRAKGVMWASQVRVIDDVLIELGGEDVEVMGFQMFQGGQLVTRETALEVWGSTRKAIDVHMRSEPRRGIPRRGGSSKHGAGDARDGL